MKVILPEEAAPFLDALPIHKFHGIGKVTADKMKRMGIRTGADLKRMDRLTLLRRFGKSGDFYYHMVRAEDRRPVNPHRIRKSIGAERTFSDDLKGESEMREQLLPILEKVYRHTQRLQNTGRTLTLKMKTADFKILTRSRSFPRELKTLEQIQEAALDLLHHHWQEAGTVRLLGVTLSNLVREHPGEGYQLEIAF
jgi:DNA polymerase-4